MPTIIECHCGGFNCSRNGDGKVITRRESGTVSFVLTAGFEKCPIFTSHTSSVDNLGVRMVSDTPSTGDVSATTQPSQ